MQDERLLERMATVETKLDYLIMTINKLEGTENKANEALLMAKENTRRLDIMEESRKQDLRLIWSTILGGFVTGLVSLIVYFLTK